MTTVLIQQRGTEAYNPYPEVKGIWHVQLSVVQFSSDAKVEVQMQEAATLDCAAALRGVVRTSPLASPLS